jgi:hypothetical protein
MGLSEEECHISRLSLEQCIQAISIMRKGRKRD